jgi:large subunit ribosomal protein L5
LARLKELYKNEIVSALMDKFKYKSIMEVPRLEKIVVNMGVGDAKDNPKFLESAVEELAAITGQKPIVTKAKKSVAAFKLRQGMNVGAKVTLRGDRMYEFYDRLVNVALPRVRDFRGVSENPLTEEETMP